MNRRLETTSADGRYKLTVAAIPKRDGAKFTPSLHSVLEGVISKWDDPTSGYNFILDELVRLAEEHSSGVAFHVAPMSRDFGMKIKVSRETV